MKNVLSWGALLLPAWEAGSTARYWGITAARPTSEGFDRAYQLDVRGAVNMTPDGYKIRYCRYCIRLASREGLFVVMVIVSGLLFLPAAGDRGGSGPGHHNNFARYWSFSAYPSNSSNAYMLYFTAGTAQRPGNFGRQMGFSIRLASREDCLL